MFSRRTPRRKQQILREALWPSMGARRLASYYKHRIGRLPGTPSQVASGFATGVAISFTPFIGLHMVLGGVIAWLSRASLIAMAVGTLAGNPWTSPFIWLATYKLGHAMQGHMKKAESIANPPAFSLTDILHSPSELLAKLIPMTIGCIPFVVLSWLATYYLCRNLIIQYRSARLARILREET